MEKLFSILAWCKDFLAKYFMIMHKCLELAMYLAKFSKTELDDKLLKYADQLLSKFEPKVEEVKPSEESK